MSGVLAMALLALLAGALLGWASRRFRLEGDPIVEQLDALLPQTQCGQCGYPGCRPYAQAIAAGEAGIDQCPPGGDAGVRALAELLGREPVPVDRSRGSADAPVRVARIVEAECIGCTKCIQACPVDAIVGASKLMHTVLADRCTGCELCIAPCPVDCIELVEPPPSRRPARRPKPAIALVLLQDPAN